MSWSNWNTSSNVFPGAVFLRRPLVLRCEATRHSRAREKGRVSLTHRHSHQLLALLSRRFRCRKGESQCQTVDLTLSMWFACSVGDSAHKQFFFIQSRNKWHTNPCNAIRIWCGALGLRMEIQRLCLLGCPTAGVPMAKGHICMAFALRNLPTVAS